MTNPQLDQAREWADDSSYQGDALSVAAARVIQALPDQWIDAEKVQELIDTYKHARDGNAAGTEGWVMNHLVVSNLESLLTPPLPTLADMPPEYREWCQWMQARLGGETESVVIVSIGTVKAWVMWDNGIIDTKDHDEVTPRPDLPRLEWPAQEPRIPETPPAETLNNASSDTPRNPRPEDVPAGEPWLVKCDGDEWVGTRESRVETVCSWTLTRLDGADYTMTSDDEITLVSRLVPEDKP